MALSGCALLPQASAPAGTQATGAAEAAARADPAPAPAKMTPPGANPTRAAPQAAPGAAPASVTVQAGMKPFAEVIKDATEIPGFFGLWRKDDKVWMELHPEDLDQPVFFTVSMNRGLGERGIYSVNGRGFDSQRIVVFHKLGNVVQLIAKNVTFTAPEGTPAARAVREAFSDSLLSAAAIVSQPEPETKAVLIEANSLLLADIPMGAMLLETTYRQSYGFDARNSSFTGVRATPQATSLSVAAHYALGRISLPSPMASTPPTPLPGTLEDVRSLFLGYTYSFAKLPQPMAPRLADDRIGHFVTTHWDFGSDSKPTPRMHFVNRWRLEKKDPAAAMSEPVQPIVYWLDRNIPQKYRPAITAGILEWNKAFEKIGFKDAIKVEQQEDDAEFDTADVKHASVKWFVGTDASFAIGPSQVDSRTGEILDADIAISDAFARSSRRLIAEEMPPSTALGASGGNALARRFAVGGRSRDYCDFADLAENEMNFALDVLEARGDIAPDSPQADAFVANVLKEIVTHEVGHTLGLRHNFRASTIYSQAQLRDVAFTKEHGLSGSVMDYNAFNLPLKGEAEGEVVMSTLGPYDYWAIEYAYRPFAPSEEKAELDKIAAKSALPELAFATDEDAGFGSGQYEGMDPDVNRLDLGNDPLAYYQRRIAISRELWERLQAREQKPGESYAILRRNFTRAMAQVGKATLLAAKYLGGVTMLRDHAGSGRTPFQPVPPERQRAALKLIAESLFSADSFRFKADFMSRLTVDFFDREDDALRGMLNPDYSLSSQVLSMQKSVLNQIYNDAVAQRILDADLKVSSPDNALRLSELYSTVQNSIWSELKSGRDIPSLRRNLQREHLARLITGLVRPLPSMPADARALLREQARQLRTLLSLAQSRRGLSPETKAHVSESLGTLDEALKAPMQRLAV